MKISFNVKFISETYGGGISFANFLKAFLEDRRITVVNHLNDDDWLFSGNNGSHYSAASIRLIIKKATKHASIKKNVHPHTLRHSFATHLIQNGYAVTEIQPLLGHNSLNTTMIYLHMASPELLKVKSPYDDLNAHTES